MNHCVVVLGDREVIVAGVAAGEPTCVARIIGGTMGGMGVTSGGGFFQQPGGVGHQDLYRKSGGGEIHHAVKSPGAMHGGISLSAEHPDRLAVRPGQTRDSGRAFAGQRLRVKPAFAGHDQIGRRHPFRQTR